MIQLITSIVNTIVGLVAFVIHSIETFISLITRIPTFIEIFFTSLGFMPSVWLPIATVVITVSIILLIIGRQ